jgi:hypothetical protein
VANFDEALETLVGGYEHRASILKPVASLPEAGAPEATKPGQPPAPDAWWSPKTRPKMTRAQFDSVPIPERLAATRTYEIVDG